MRKPLRYWRKGTRRQGIYQSGIYFLIRDGIIIYIGKTKFLPVRLAGHSVRDYDTYRLIPCAVDKLAVYEERWIKRFKPVKNKHFNTDKVVFVGFYTKYVNVDRAGGMQAAREKAKVFLESVPA